MLFPNEGHGFARPENSEASNGIAEGVLETAPAAFAADRDELEGSSITMPTGAAGVPGLAEALKTHTAQARH